MSIRVMPRLIVRESSHTGTVEDDPISLGEVVKSEPVLAEGSFGTSDT